MCRYLTQTINLGNGFYTVKRLDTPRISDISSQRFQAIVTDIGVYFKQVRKVSHSRMDVEALKYWVALRAVEEVGCVGFRNLLAAFASPRRVFETPASILQRVPGIGPKTADHIRTFSDWAMAEREVSKAVSLGVSILTCQDPLYPQRLLKIYDYPPFLYLKGSLLSGETAVAVVGSRLASVYGRFVTEKLSRELAMRGVSVVSGLARGIDAAAHRGALAGKGRTIAVLGCGLDVVYPPENEALAAEIASRGALVTEYPFGTQPDAPHFPARNRLISGLSLGVVVVEAGEKSGSLITARIAAEQGRSVFAVPGEIGSAGSRGTHHLIRQGAQLVESVDDILEEILPQAGVPPEAAPASAREAAATGQQTASREVPMAADPAAPEPNDPSQGLGEVERRLMAVIGTEPAAVDTLIAATGLSAQRVQSGLLVLELMGLIRRLPGKQYQLKESVI
jgi:DNA processing protein